MAVVRTLATSTIPYHTIPTKVGRCFEFDVGVLMLD